MSGTRDVGRGPRKPMKRLSDKRRATLEHTPFSTLSRSSGIAKKNAKRRQSEFARCYGSKERVAWVKSLPCAVSGVRGDIENVHCRGDGAGRKADARFILPMSRELHRKLHSIGVGSFELLWSVDLEYLAEQTEAAWQSTRRTTRSQFND